MTPSMLLIHQHQDQQQQQQESDATLGDSVTATQSAEGCDSAAKAPEVPEEEAPMTAAESTEETVPSEEIESSAEEAAESEVSESENDDDYDDDDDEEEEDDDYDDEASAATAESTEETQPSLEVNDESSPKEEAESEELGSKGDDADDDEEQEEAPTAAEESTKEIEAAVDEPESPTEEAAESEESESEDDGEEEEAPMAAAAAESTEETEAAAAMEEDGSPTEEASEDPNAASSSSQLVMKDWIRSVVAENTTRLAASPRAVLARFGVLRRSTTATTRDDGIETETMTTTTTTTTLLRRTQDGIGSSLKKTQEVTMDAYHAAGRFVKETVALGKRKFTPPSPDIGDGVVDFNNDVNNDDDGGNENDEEEVLESPAKRPRLEKKTHPEPTTATADESPVVKPSEEAETAAVVAAAMVTPVKPEVPPPTTTTTTSQQPPPDEPVVVVESPFEFVDFVPSGKKSLPRGPLFEAVGGNLLDRDDSIQTLYRSLEALAGRRGRPDLSPESVPLIGITGPAGVGKTEFLRWAFHDCCSFRRDPPPSGVTAKALVRMLNEASPDDQEPLENLLFLYASFSGESAYSKDEGPICGTTIERLLRSFHGDVVFRDDDDDSGGGGDGSKPLRYKGFERGGQSILDVFAKEHGKTGVVFLLDDLDAVERENRSEYDVLLESVLGFSQRCLAAGSFCAVVGTATSAHDLCRDVRSETGRPVLPVEFPKEMPEMEARVRKILLLRSGDDSDDDDSHDDSHDDDEYDSNLDEGLGGMSLSVTLKVLQSSYRARAWEDFLCGPTTTTAEILAEPLARRFRMPRAVSPELVFELAARTALGKEIPTFETSPTAVVAAVVDGLSGRRFIATDEDGRAIAGDDHGPPTSTLSLPAWRLFQFHAGYGGQVFPQVRNWVLVECRKLFYEYGPAESTKTLETATLALLELRRAMLQAADDEQRPPTLDELYGGISSSMHRKLSPSSLSARAADRPVDIRCFSALPHAFEVVREPTLYLSNAPDERGVEGILRRCFRKTTDDGVGAELAVFFRTKLYTAVGPDEIRDWLASAHKRARQLGYERGGYVVQLFVPGNVVDDEEEDVGGDDPNGDWPMDSMVVSDGAMMDLFDPFVSLKSILVD